MIRIKESEVNSVKKFQQTKKYFYCCQKRSLSDLMHTSASKQKQNSFRKSKGIQVLSNIRHLTHDQSISSPSIKKSEVQHRDQKYKTKEIIQNRAPEIIKRNLSFIIDYHNARYHGQIESKETKLIKNGPGILVDDDMNLIFSNWKNNLPDGKTVLIDRLGNYFYSKLKSPFGSPIGIAILRIGTILLLIRFSQKTGAWDMTENEKENIMIAIDEKEFSLVVLKGKIQEVSGELKCVKSSPLSVVQFAHFATPFTTQQNKKQANYYKSGTSHINKNAQNTQTIQIQDILLTYAQKYGFKMENCQFSISDFMQSIAYSINKEYLGSKQFSYEVKRNLPNKFFYHQSNNRQPIQQNLQSFEKQKKKIYDKNFIVFAECDSHSSKIKEKSFYFGFLNGLGIKFKNQLNQEKMKGSQKTQSFKPKSIGIHNQQIRIEEIGVRFYDNNCIEEGNFKTKNTFTYQNPLFRPANKLTSIYNKFHKQQTTFLNEYFDRNQIQIHKLMAIFTNFVNEHIVYILNECLIETTKFNQKSQKDELVEKIMLKNYQNSKLYVESLIKQSNLKRLPYEVEIERRGKDKILVQNNKNRALNQLKEKKSELKERIKKVKYEIQYLPQNDNVIFMTDNKFMSKIKKHLSYHINQTEEEKNKVSRNKGKSKSDRSRSKSVVLSRSKSRKTYIQKEKPKVTSPDKKNKNSPTKKKLNHTRKQVEQKPEKIIDLLKSQTRAKTEAELILDKINHSIQFRQKFNYGIEFNVENDYASKNSRRKNQSPTKNMYNGRNRFFTDEELDDAVDKHLSSSSQVSVNTITPGKKNKKKEQYRHMIYSNIKRNHNNQEEKYEQQKQTEEVIRAQILGLSMEEYRKKIERQKQQHAFMQQNFLKLIAQEQSTLKNSIKRISQELQELPDPNETFGNHVNEPIKFSQSKIHKISGQNQDEKMSFLQSQDKNQVTQSINSIFQDTIYCPKPKQQSLIEKRLRIIQDYKELNGRYAEREESGYVPLYNNNLKSKNRLSPSFRDYSPVDIKKQKFYQKLPVYEEKASCKVLSPLKSMIQNRENSDITPYGRSSYIGLESSKQGIMHEKDQSIGGNISETHTKFQNKQHKQASFLEHGAAKSLTRKYQYYFD